MHTDVSNPVLTVSIAAYNAEQYLNVALDSCLCEAGTGRLEVIVVDDGSTDGTGAVADAYARENPGLFRVIHKENGNYGSALNRSLGVARGRYYRLLDSDDWFDAEGLKAHLDVLMACDADICVTASVRVMAESGTRQLVDPVVGAAAGDYPIGSAPVEKIPGPGISNLTFRTGFLRDIDFAMLEGRSYVDEELRIVPWLSAKTLRIDHIPVYRVLKEREGQSTSMAGLRKAARDKRAVLEHLLSVIEVPAPDAVGAESQALDELCDLVIGCYLNMLLLEPEREVAEEMRSMDRWLRGLSGQLYQMSGRSKTVRALRLSRFALYPVLARRMIARWSYA